MVVVATTSTLSAQIKCHWTLGSPFALEFHFLCRTRERKVPQKVSHSEGVFRGKHLRGGLRF